MVTVSDVEGSARLLRPRDDDALRAELRVIAAGFATPAVIFGGPVSAGTLKISETLGIRTAGLRGLLISPMLGLGGRAMTQLRPQWVEDYATAQTITHDYDRPVINEGLRSVVAVPVVVGGGPRAIIYAALRQSAPLGGRLFDMLSRAGNRLAAEITIRDEVDRRVELIDTLVDGGHAPTTTGRHFFRPAHLHVKLRHPDHEEMTSQLYFQGGEYLDDDVANGVREGLVIALHTVDDPARLAENGLNRPYTDARYDFVLVSASAA